MSLQRIFRDFLIFKILPDDKKHVYIDFISSAANDHELFTIEETDELLADLFKIVDPLIELCNLESRSFIVTVDMKDANPYIYKFNILSHIIKELHEHIQTDREDLTQQCNIKNAPKVIRVMFPALRLFIKPHFLKKIHFI